MQQEPWKRHIRSYHQIPCQIGDIFIVLRDLVNMYRLRDHINHRICLQFNPTKDSIAPISDRPDLRMHLRYRSVPGILVGTPLVIKVVTNSSFFWSSLSFPPRVISSWMKV